MTTEYISKTEGGWMEYARNVDRLLDNALAANQVLARDAKRNRRAYRFASIIAAGSSLAAIVGWLMWWSK